MDSLSLETLTLIFSHLHLYQKQECMLVCRNWRNVISTSSYLTTIYISRTINFDRLFQVLNNVPMYRSQITHLILNDNVAAILNEQQVLDYFPNLRSVRMGLSNLTLQSTPGMDNNSLANMKAWQDQIVRKESISQYLPNDSIMVTGSYLGLTKLVIDKFYFTMYRATVLENAPNITSLKLLRSPISLNELVVIHAGLNALESLELEDVTLAVSNEPAGLVAENSASIRTVLINFEFEDVDIVLSWLQFIRINYTRLENFRFAFPWTSQISTLDEERLTDNGLVPLLRSRGLFLQNVDISCANGVPQVLATINQLYHAPTLHFRTVFSVTRTSFETLDDNSKYINQLTISLNSPIRLKSNNLREIKTLRSIKIGKIRNVNFPDNTVFLNEFLDSCPPQLEALEIFDFNVECSSKLFQGHPLQSLSIHTDTIPVAVYQLISRSLPGLNRLIINHRAPNVQLEITLNTVKLKYLELSLNCSAVFTINTTSDGASYSYRPVTYDDTDFNDTTPNSNDPLALTKAIPSNQIGNLERVIRITCESIGTLIINDRLAF